MPTYRVTVHYRRKTGQRRIKQKATYAMLTAPCEREARLRALVQHVEKNERVLRIEARPI